PSRLPSRNHSTSGRCGLATVEPDGPSGTGRAARPNHQSNIDGPLAPPPVAARYVEGGRVHLDLAIGHLLFRLGDLFSRDEAATQRPQRGHDSPAFLVERP